MYLLLPPSQAPFHITPDPQFFFLSPSHQAALGAIAYGIASRQDLVAIFGEAGVGKTTLLRTYLAHVNPQELKTIFVFNEHLAFDDLLKLIFRNLGLTVTTDDPLVLCVSSGPSMRSETGRHVALIIDEAQAMPVGLSNSCALSTLKTRRHHPADSSVGRPGCIRTPAGHSPALDQRLGSDHLLTRQEAGIYPSPPGEVTQDAALYRSCSPTHCTARQSAYRSAEYSLHQRPHR